MTAVGLVSILIAMLGGCALLIALSWLYSIGGEPEEPVGPWRGPRAEASQPPALPREFDTLIWGANLGWRQDRQWEATMDSLDQLEAEFGGGAMARVERFDDDWLDSRIARIEELAGPMPGPMPPPVITRKIPFWKRWFL